MTMKKYAEEHEKRVEEKLTALVDEFGLERKDMVEGQEVTYTVTVTAKVKKSRDGSKVTEWDIQTS